MLACIACSKHVNGSSVEPSMVDEDDIPKSPATRETIRSLTNQLKGMAVRFSAGAYRHCKPCAAQDFNREGGHCINSMDITDASSEVSMSSTQNMGSNYYSTPPQSFKRTPSRRNTDHAYSYNKHNKNRNISTNHGINNGYGGNNLLNNTGNISAPENGSKSEYEEDEIEKEWVAQVEPGVLITFVTLQDGGNDLKRIRFSREMFNKQQAQQWWAENCDKVHELYNVPKFSRLPGSLPTPSRSEDEKSQSSGEYQKGKPHNKREAANHNHNHNHVRAMSMYDGDHLGGHEDTSACPPSEWDEAAHFHSSVKEEGAHHLNNYSGSEAVSASGMEDPLSNNEWVQEDEPGVYITLTSSSRGVRELKRIRFSREKFTEMQARLWWEENRLRVHEQYL